MDHVLFTNFERRNDTNKLSASLKTILNLDIFMM